MDKVEAVLIVSEGVQKITMTVKDFITKLNTLKFSNDTNSFFQFSNGDEGEYYNYEIRNIDDEDREVGCDNIVVQFNKPVDYIASEVKCVNIGLREELGELINRYM